MTIDISIYEDSGPEVSGGGTTRSEVDNIGWKLDSQNENASSYPDHTIRHPDVDGDINASYVKYHHFKIFGPYARAAQPVIVLTLSRDPPADFDGPSVPVDYWFNTPQPSPAVAKTGPVRIGYKLTETYETPSALIDGDMQYVFPGQTVRIYPKLSNTGPDTGQSYVNYQSSGVTYYTQYIATQLLVEHNLTGDPWGNIPDFTMKIEFDEYEDGDS